MSQVVRVLPHINLSHQHHKSGQMSFVRHRHRLQLKATHLTISLALAKSEEEMALRLMPLVVLDYAYMAHRDLVEVVSYQTHPTVRRVDGLEVL